MGTFEDLTGRRFSRLVVIKETGRFRGGAVWLCQCDCGKMKEIPAAYLKNGRAKSCGCLQSDNGKSTPPDLYDGTKIGGMKRKIGKNNTSGATGVYYDRRRGIYTASIGLRKKNIYLGTFATFEEAKKAREKAEEEYYAPLIEAYEKEAEGCEEIKAGARQGELEGRKQK